MIRREIVRFNIAVILIFNLLKHLRLSKESESLKIHKIQKYSQMKIIRNLSFLILEKPDIRAKIIKRKNNFLMSQSSKRKYKKIKGKCKINKIQNNKSKIQTTQKHTHKKLKKPKKLI